MTPPARSVRSRATAYRYHPAGPAWDHPFFRRVAEGLARLPEGEGLLCEATGNSDPWLVPGSGAVEQVVTGAALGLPGRLERITPVPPVPPPFVGGLGFAVVRPGSAPDGERARSQWPVAPDQNPDEGDRWRPREAEPLEGWAGWSGAVQWHWFSSGGEKLAVRVRLASVALGPAGGTIAELAAPVLARLPRATGPVELEARPVRWRTRRAWARGTVAGLWAGPPFELSAVETALAIRPRRPAGRWDDPVLRRHVAVLGASGSGKSSFLAHLARQRIEAGGATVVFDIHGDLGPSIAAGLSENATTRVVAVDTAGPERSIRGVRLFAGTDPAHREREATHLVASLRHLSHDGNELYWGTRLEQVFDVFVRLVEEEDGGFGDLFELLTDPMRREASRLATRRPAAARFLEELPGLLRRNPEYLQPAVARVQKVLLQPKLKRLLDAEEGALDLEPLLAEGRSLLVRIPGAELGPSGSRFAATLLASRIYLAAATRAPDEGPVRVLAVLDEAHAIAPSLLAEMLAEGRKFGVAVAMATQYASRLAPEAREAAEGAAGTHLVFQVPRASAALAGRWAGLDRVEAERLLPALPPGVALASLALDAGPRTLLTVPPRPSGGAAAWRRLCERSEPAEGPDGPEGAGEPGVIGPDEALLLGLTGLEEAGRPTSAPDLIRAALAAVPALAPVDLASAIPRLVRRGWVEVADGSHRLTPAGAHRLGMGVPSGATREGAEHRALLIEAFRIFARRGERMEFVRQGRFDTRLPDGRVRLLAGGNGRDGPAELLRRLNERSGRWVWRAFGGRDLHVEAEVSGAERPERIRRGLAKARSAGAAVVFLVGDARRARKVREVLARGGATRTEAQVWTLPHAAALRHRDEPERPSPASGP